MERKEFIKACGAICLGGTALAFLQSCKNANYYATVSSSGDKISIKKSEFIQVKKEKTSERKYVLVRNEKLNYPICVFKLGADAYSAVLLQCTHKSCEHNPQGNYLVCPCHGSEFNHLGIVQNPPAETNLATFKVNQDNENIYIQL